MSQYGSPVPEVGTRLGRNEPANIPGVTESLATPGLASMPVTESDGLKAFQDLSASLGLAGNAVALYGQQQEQQASRDAAFKRHSDQVDRAKALEHAETNLPGYISQVQDGLIVPTSDVDGKSQTATQAQQWAKSIAGDGTDTYSAELRRFLAPHLARALEFEREKRIKTAAIETAKDYRALLYTTIAHDGSEPGNAGNDYVKPTANADDPPITKWRGGGVPDNVEEILNDGLSKTKSRLDRDQFISLSVMPAIRMAAKNGDTEAIDKLSKFVPDAFADGIENARITASRTDAARQVQQSKVVDRWIGDAEYAAISGDGDFQTARDRVDRAYRDGLIDSQDAIRRRSSIDVAERAAVNENKGLLENVREAQLKDAAVNAAREHIGQGGSSASLPDFKYLTPTGEEKTVTGKELAKDAVQADFDLIDTGSANKLKAIEASDGQPQDKQRRLESLQQQIMGQKVRRLQKAGDTYEPWSKGLNAASSLASPEMLAQPGPLPKDLQDAVALRDRMPDDLFWRHVRPENRQFWHLLDLTRTYYTGTTPSGLKPALATVSEMMARDPLTDEVNARERVRIDNKKLLATVDEFSAPSGDTIINKSFLANEVKALAEYQMRPPFNAAEDVALAAAKDTVMKSTKFFNGYAVPTLGVHVPAELDRASPLLIQEFVAKHPEYKAEDLTLRPYLDNTWMIVRGDHADSPVMIPLDTFPDDGFYSAKQIDDMLPGLMTRARAKWQTERAEAWRAYNATPPVPRGTGRNILE